MNEFRAILRQLRRATENDLRRLYLQVFGAQFSGAVTPERARESIKEACKEMLERGRLSPQPAGQEHMIMAKKGEAEMLLVETVEKGFNAIIEKLDAIDQGIQSMLIKSGGEAPAKPAAPKKEKPKAEEFVPGSKKLEPVKAEPPSIETMRELATRYSAAFGMNDLLAAFQRFGGAKKLSDVAPDALTLLHTELSTRLKSENGKKATEAKPAEGGPTVTLEAVKPQAKAFLEKNGKEAFAALLKSFGSAKLSEVPAEKLPAFLEAITNA